MNQVLQPEGWVKPVGYSNGVAAEGRLVFVAGQIGWNARGEFESDDFVGQFRQCLKNIVAVLAEAGAEAAHITSMTWYFVDKQDYLANLKAIGAAYREVIGRHYPTMTAMQVTALIEDRAIIEIQAMAVASE